MLDTDLRVALDDLKDTLASDFDTKLADHKDEVEAKLEATAVGRTDAPATSGDTMAALMHPTIKSLYGGTGDGQYVVPVEHARFLWDRLAAESVALASGMYVLPTSAISLHVPTLDADAASAWVSEGSEISETDPGFTETIATPRKLAALTAISNEAMGDSDPAIGGLVGTNLARSLALKLDLGIFEGTGVAPIIRGLKNVANIQTWPLATDGLIPANLDFAADAVGALAEKNATARAFYMHPSVWRVLLKLKDDTTDSNRPLLEQSGGGNAIERKLFGVPVWLSSQLATTEVEGASGGVCRSIYCVDTTQTIVVRRSDVTLALDKSRLFNFDMTEIRATSRWDLIVPNPDAVVRITGIKVA